MIFSKITQQEIKYYFNQSFGYQTIVDSYGLYIFSLDKKEFGFIFLRSKKNYWTPWFFLNLWLESKLLNIPLKVEFYRFLMHTHLERETKRNQLKSK